jgi:hypothetical protein
MRNEIGGILNVEKGCGFSIIETALHFLTGE